jgi:hypothetical protein
VEILIADPPPAWEALGFTVSDGNAICLDGVRIRLGGRGSGIAGLKLRNLEEGQDLDGLPMGASATPPSDPSRHPIGATAVDHVVALTPDLDRTTRKLIAAGFDHRPSRGRQEFFVLGPCLLELAARADEEPRFWGLTLVVEDIDAAAQRPGVGAPKRAVQPGRRIATVGPEGGLGTALALMTPR